jgi:ELWxxDGT repeat protein
MKTFFRTLALASIVAMMLYACNTPVAPTPTDDAAGLLEFDGNPASVGLSVVAVNASAGFNAVGQMINYSYTVSNTGITPLPGPVTVSDDKTTVPACAGVNTVGNGNNTLDSGESVLCTSSYTVQQNDITNTQVVSNAVARVANTDSNRVTTTVRMAQSQVLTVSCTTNPTSYSAAGQTITYSYTVKNIGTTAVGPTQFSVKDSLFSAAINCDVPNRILGPNETISCPGTYSTTQNDMGLNQIANSVTASGGTAISPAASCAVAKSTTPPPSGNFTPNSTIQHSVQAGEWLYQIARCYGADIKATLAANPQIPNPNYILPAMIVTVPNIGSKGTPIFGPPCVGYYVVQVGDTWDNIKTRFNADIYLLQTVNRNASLSNGTCIKIPLNSAYGTTRSQTAATACPVGTVPTQPAVNPIRITPNITLTGSVQPSGRIRYVFAATQGQSLSVRLLNAPANEITLGIFTATGTTIKAQDANLTFSGTIPSNGDTNIDIVAVSGSSIKNFTLEVILGASNQSSFERVTDINPAVASSDPAYLAEFNGQLFFRATGNDNAGAELWRYDPATKNSTRAKDINPGPTGSDPAYLTSYNGALYFRAIGDTSGVELWRWNGSDAGRLTDINPGSGDANPAHLAVFNNKLYFSARGGEGVELWMTDGTSTTLAADINVGPGDSNPAFLTAFKNALYFSAVSTDGKGVELYRFDGTNPPVRVTDINPDANNSNPAYLTEFNGALYFSAVSNDSKGIELWRYDGTNNPVRVTDINPEAGDAAPSFLEVFNGALYFSAISNDGKGIELWKYDGSTPKLVGDLNTVGNSSPSYLIAFNNELYFQANGNDNAGTEIWKFKGP